MDDVKKAWDNLLGVLGGRWNVMGLDLKNEPHGKATWGFGDKKTDWCVLCVIVCVVPFSSQPSIDIGLI
jgi:aryl-phospho-beta-D-glucosidase BglC (GH1 family)